MQYSYLYTPVAAKQYTNTVQWYNKRSVQAAENFIVEVEQKINTICSDPKRYANHYKNFRETSLKKYPYSIIYFVDEPNKTIVITALHPHKSTPKRKYKIGQIL
jgi:plasmid stabilization system protein ParE